MIVSAQDFWFQVQPWIFVILVQYKNQYFYNILYVVEVSFML